MAEVDRLTISIEAASDTAGKNLANLTKKLESLRAAAASGAGLEKPLEAIRELSNAASSIDSNASSRIQGLVQAIKSLKELKGVSISSSISNQLQSISTAANGIDSSSASKLEAFTNALNSLRSLSGLTISSSIANQLTNLGNAISNIRVTDKFKLKDLADGLRPLTELGKANLSSFISQLGKMPEVMQKLDEADIGKFAEKIKEVTEAIQPLATEMNKVASGFSAFPDKIQKLIKNMDTLPKSNKKAADSFGFLGTGISSLQAKFTIYLGVFRRVASVMSGWVAESNAYVENLNLFTVTMGEAADEALRYAETVQQAVGIDPSDWIRNQGMFKQITSGFGVVEEKANLMSKNLTQLGYDISSFYNISTEDAMQKLQSAIAGELEPLRRLGYATDVATLQQVALAHGITQSVNSMNQAQKSQLRYLAIMEQSGNVMGDLARTVQTPANAMRILKQELTQLARAAGNLLIPALQSIIPVVQAVVEILTEAIQALANLFGFELPKIDYSGLEGVTSGAEDAEDALDEAAGAAKEFKRQLIGIDELTILDLPSSSGGGSAVPNLGGDLDLDLPEYDFLKDLSERTDEIKEKIKGLIPVLALVGAAFAAWKFRTEIKDFFENLFSGKFNQVIGMSLMISGFTISLSSAFDIGYDGPTLENVIKTALGNALMIGGSLLTLGTGPAGWLVGIGLSIVVDVTGILMGWSKAMDEIREQMVFDTFFNEQGIAIEDLADSYAVLIEKIGQSYGPINEAADAIQANRERVSELSSDIGLLYSGIDNGVLSIEETLPKITQAFQDLYDNTKPILEKQRDMILFALSGATGDAYEQMGGDLVGAAGLVISTTDDMIKDLDGFNSEVQRIQKDISSGAISQEEGFRRLEEATKDYGSILSVVSPDITGFRDSLAKITDGINWGDYESIKGSFNTVADAASQSKVDINSAFDETKKALDDLITYIEQNGGDASVFKSLQQANEQARQDALSEVDSQVQGFINDVSTQILTDAQDQYDKALEEWDSLGWFAQSFKYGGESAKFVQEALTDYKNNIVIPITDDMKSAFSDTLGEDSTWADSAMEQLIDDLFTTDYIASVGFAKKRTLYGKSISEAITDSISENIKSADTTPITQSLNSVITSGMSNLDKQEIKKLMSGIGEELPNGLYEGASQKMQSSKTAWTDWAMWPWNWFKEANDIHSPSKKFEELGGYMSDGLYNGVTGKKDSLLSGITQWAGDIWGKVKEGFANVPDWFSEKFGTAYQQSKNTWSNAQQDFSGISSNVEMGFDNVAPDLESKFSSAYARAQGSWGSAESNFKGIANTTVNAFSAVSGGIYEKFRSAFESAQSAAGSISWYSTGSNIVSGILNGMYNWGNTLRSWANSLLNAAKNALGIHSPSTLFRDEVGLYMGLGISKGLENSEPNILSTMANISSDMQDSVAFPAVKTSNLTAHYEEDVYSHMVTDDMTENIRESNEEVINALWAAARQIIRAIEEKDTDVIIDGERATSVVTDRQNRQTRMYGKPVKV